MLPKIVRSVPANTTKDLPDWQKLAVPEGTIVQWIIFFDPEAADLLHVRVEYHGTSIIPWGGKEWIEAFFSSAPIFDNILIDKPKYELDIFAYNEDDTHAHEYFIHPVIIREEPVKIPEVSQEVLKSWKKLFGGGS